MRKTKFWFSGLRNDVGSSEAMLLTKGVAR